MSVVILTGASGAGKTTITKKIAEQRSDVVCLFFDSIGIPTIEEMIAQYGSGEGWQKAKTDEWLRRIKSSYGQDQLVLFEGQSRISFIQEAIATNAIQGAIIVLVDCRDKVRNERLRGERNQPALANEQMMNWAQFLRDEAKEAKIKILDTSDQAIDQSVNEINRLLMKR